MEQARTGFGADERFRLVVESAPSGMLMVDATGRIVLVNAQLERQFGYSRHELLGQSVEILVPARFRGGHPQYRAAFFAHPSVRAMGAGRELFALRKDGTEFPVEIGLTPIEGPEGRQVLCAIVDITERKRIEERFRLVVESAPSGMLMVDTHGRILLVNAQLERQFGYAREELLGQLVEVLIPARFRGHHPEHRGSFFAQPSVRPMGAGRDLFGLRKDGSEFPVEIALNPIDTPDGRQVLCSIIDITERKSIEADRENLLASAQAAREEAERANRLKDEFLAVVSHELRTPLNAIVGWSDLLAKRQLTGSEAEKALETIRRNSRTQLQLIEDLLDVSRVIAGQLRLNLRTVDLPTVLTAALDTIRPAAAAKEIRVQPLIDPQAGPITGDADRLQQIVWNLLSNAVKFTPRGGRVQLRLQRVNSHVEIVVSDTGHGISAEFLPHVFDRFSQADSSMTRGFGGLGLGLAIVRHLVELHGGTVSVESPGLDHGATFTVKLPVQVLHERRGKGEDRVHPAAEGLTASAKPLTLPSLQGERILVVDDERDTLDLLATVFQHAGAEVQAADSAASALEAVKAWRPTLIISDIGMPGEDGYDLIEKVRVYGRERKVWTPAIALTAYARSEDRLRALQAGFQAHISKPVDPTELLMIAAGQLARTKG